MKMSSKVLSVARRALLTGFGLSALASSVQASLVLSSYTDDEYSFTAVYNVTSDASLIAGFATNGILDNWQTTLTQTYTPAVLLGPAAKYTFVWAGAHLAHPHAFELPLLLVDLGTCDIPSTGLTGTYCETTTYVDHLAINDIPSLSTFHQDVYTFKLELMNGTGTATITGTHADLSQVPVPAAVWLFASGLGGMVAVGRRKKLFARS